MKSKANPKSEIRTPKLTVGVLFGGRSSEHEVSLVSATSVINALDKNKYEVIPIGITHEGKWISSPDALQMLKEHSKINAGSEKILLPDPTKQNLLEINQSIISQIEIPNSKSNKLNSQISNSQLTIRNSKFDAPKSLAVLFPVLHGSYGEDGTMQGLFELAGIPYVGAGVLGSSVGMDKIIAKQLFEQAGIPVSPYLWYLASDYKNRTNKIIQEIEKKLGYPCFVKPANSGSSVGISKSHNRKELIASFQLAMDYDRKILVEKGIENAREIEVSVLGNDNPEASIPGEIISSNEFYDYDAKYVDGKSEAVIPAKLSPALRKKIQELAIRGFKAIDCLGMGRVDFLVTKKTNKIYLNEINTIPGFTSISMYPKLWEASGLNYPQLLDKLIDLAIERHSQKQALKTTFQPKNDWYKKS